jgi:hypothetical protein
MSTAQIILIGIILLIPGIDTTARAWQHPEFPGLLAQGACMAVWMAMTVGFALESSDTALSELVFVVIGMVAVGSLTKALRPGARRRWEEYVSTRPNDPLYSALVWAVHYALMLAALLALLAYA